MWMAIAEGADAAGGDAQVGCYQNNTADEVQHRRVIVSTIKLYAMWVAIAETKNFAGGDVQVGGTLKRCGRVLKKR